MNWDTASTMLLKAPEAIDMGETLKERVMFTAPTGTKERLKAWAESEHRTVSNLCEKLILEALAHWEASQKEAEEKPNTK